MFSHNPLLSVLSALFVNSFFNKERREDGEKGIDVQVGSTILLLFVVFLCGCAVSRPFDETAGFIPNREVKVVALTREGLSYYQKSRFVDAELKLRQALYLAPDADNLKNNLAIALLGSGQIDEGEEMLLALAKKYPQASRYYVDLGEARTRRRDLNPALDAFRVALDRAWIRADYTAAATLLRSRSVAHFDFGDEEAALCGSAEAYNLKSDQIELIRHVRMLIATNNFSQAKILIQTASNANRLLQQDPEVLRHLAFALYGLKEFQEASDIVQRATDMSKALPEIQSSLKVLTELVGSHLGVEPDSEFSYPELGTFELLYWPFNLIADYEAKRLTETDS